MTTASIEARTLTLARLERAAGQAFGCEQEGAAASRLTLVGPTTIALATFATALAATISYLI